MCAVQPEQRDAFAKEFNVPRGTMAKFDRYVALVNDWQMRMNLVGPTTLPSIWDRHIRDSAQLSTLRGDIGSDPLWLDIGAGAGFPGLVLAILGAGRVCLVESTSKKARFLHQVSDDLGLGDRVRVANCRVESLPNFRADFITARACASLTQLFDWGLGFAAHSTSWVLPKGATVEAELAAAACGFDFEASLHPSLTDARGQIVVARGVRRR